MTSHHRFELASDARAAVARALILLERPEVKALDSSTAVLAEAVALLEQVKEEGSEGGAGLHSILTELRNDLRLVRTLLRHAWELRVGPGGQAGYTRQGEPAQQQPPAGGWALEA